MDDMAISVGNLTKTFRKTDKKTSRRKGWLRSVAPKGTPTRVLDSVSLEVKRGEIFGVLGPNGSGKSTLVRIISTLLLPDGGEAKVFGRDVVRDPVGVQRLINRVSADAAFFRKLSAMENLIHTSRLYGLPVAESKRRAKQILDRMGMKEDKADAEMHELSRGMQQKVALARAFLTSPVLMLLDEPTTGLDPKAKRDVQEFIVEVRRDHDATVLLTTHDMAEAEALCDRIAILDNGKVVAAGTAEELKARAKEARPSGLESEATPTLEQAFMALTGHALEGASEEVE